MAKIKRLTRSKKNKMIAGVCGGFAEYFELDPTLIRIGYIGLTVFTAGFPGIFAYGIMTVIIPQD